MPLTIEVFNRRSGIKDKPKQTYFRIKAGNGEIIAQSEGYSREVYCFDTVELLRTSLADARVVDKTDSTVRREKV